MPERATGTVNMEEKMVAMAKENAKKTAAVAKSVKEKGFSVMNILKRLAGK